MSKRKTVTSKKLPGKQKAPRAFTVKQQKLIDCYDGDIQRAAKKVPMSYGYARQLLTKSNILEAIKKRQDTEIRPKTIMARQQRQQFWSDVANDKNVDMKDRLRASELLGKSEADFTDNLSHKFPEGCGVMVVAGQIDPDKWKKQSEEHHKHGSNSTE